MVVGVKADSLTYKTIKIARAFALNILGKEQKASAFTFFRPAEVSDGKISGQPFRKGIGSPRALLQSLPSARVKRTRLARPGTIISHSEKQFMDDLSMPLPPAAQQSPSVSRSGPRPGTDLPP